MPFQFLNGPEKTKSSGNCYPPNYLIGIFTHLKLWSTILNIKCKLFRFDKIEVNDFEILLIDVNFINKIWTKTGV